MNRSPRRRRCRASTPQPVKMAPEDVATRLRQRVDRLPTRAELLSIIRWHQYLVHELSADRNRLAGELAEVIIGQDGAS